MKVGDLIKFDFDDDTKLGIIVRIEKQGSLERVWISYIKDPDNVVWAYKNNIKVISEGRRLKKFEYRRP